MIVTILISIPFGMFGLMWGIVAASAIALVINTHYSGKFIHYNGFEQIKDVLPILSIGLIAGALTWTVDQMMIFYETLDISRIILGGLIGIISYVIMSIIFKIRSFYDVKNIITKDFKA